MDEFKMTLFDNDGRAPDNEPGDEDEEMEGEEVGSDE